MGEDLQNMVRSQWFAIIRWLAGLSTLLIAISFSILFFRPITICSPPIIAFLLMLLFLGLNIGISFWLQRVGLEFYNEMARIQNTLTKESKNEFEGKAEVTDKIVRKGERHSKIALILGFIFLCLYIIKPYISC